VEEPADSAAVDAEWRCQWVEFQEALARLIGETLSEREAMVLALRYGLYGFCDHSLSEAGKLLDRSPGRIWQIESKGLRRMRHPMRTAVLYEAAPRGVIDQQRIDRAREDRWGYRRIYLKLVRRQE
jgi:DNA-directed RNA polymerase sigma subunit (sigma70/sigma32)